MSRNAVMRKALGATVEEECRLGVSKIANVSTRTTAHVSDYLPELVRPSQDVTDSLLTFYRGCSCSRATSDSCSPTSSRR